MGRNGLFRFRIGIAAEWIFVYGYSRARTCVIFTVLHKIVCDENQCSHIEDELKMKQTK